MKYPIIILVCVMAIFTSCMTMGAVPQVNYSEIVDVSGVTKDELFVNTNLWAVGFFNKADSVIEFSDKNAGIISGKFIGDSHPIMGGLSGRQSVKSIFTISVKDEKIKLDLKPTGLMTYDGYGRLIESSYVGVKAEDISAEYNAILESLKNALLKTSDW